MFFDLTKTLIKPYTVYVSLNKLGCSENTLHRFLKFLQVDIVESKTTPCSKKQVFELSPMFIRQKPSLFYQIRQELYFQMYALAPTLRFARFVAP